MTASASSGRIQTPYGYETTAGEVIAGVDLAGKRAIVTGGASGIGIEIVRALATAGAAVTIADRDLPLAEKAAAGIVESLPGGVVESSSVDLLDRSSIAMFAAGWEGPVDILVNNAGVMALPELTLTPEGRELQFATNHLGHFALTVGLFESLAAAGDARIVAVSSSAHLRSPVIFDDLDFAFRDYDPFTAYGQSKTANVLFAVEATRRWADAGITANALMPGGAATNIQQHVPDYLDEVRAATGGKIRFKTTHQAAATSVFLATSPLLQGVGGRYFEDCNEAEMLTRRVGAATAGVAPYALDPANAERLWETSLDLLGR